MPPLSNPLETKENADGRKTRYRLQRIAGGILGDQDARVSKCGRYMKADRVTLARPAAGKTYLAGVQTCGSVWTCAVCAGKIAEGRREDVASVLCAHEATGGHQHMVTFTIPHGAHDFVRDLKRVVANAWTQLLTGEKWKRIQRRYGEPVGFKRGAVDATVCAIEPIYKIHWIRALEVTVGPNGWHPHLHVILCTRAISDDDRRRLFLWLRRRWLKAIHAARPFEDRQEMRNALRRAVDFRKADAEKLDYVTKWGVDSEIAKAASKISRAKSRGGKSPWQLLADAADGSSLARHRFREYAEAMFGARHLTWSRGFRDLYLATPEKSDAELARADAPLQGHEEIGHFRKGTWLRIVEADARADVLRAADEGGWPAVLAYLRHAKLAIPLECFGDDGPP